MSRYLYLKTDKLVSQSMIQHHDRQRTQQSLLFSKILERSNFLIPFLKLTKLTKHLQLNYKITGTNLNVIITVNFSARSLAENYCL